LFGKSNFYRPIFYAACAQKDTGYALVLAEANADMMPTHLDLIAGNIDEDSIAIILMDHAVGRLQEHSYYQQTTVSYPYCHAHS